MVDINKNPPWFRNDSQCRYTGQPVSHPKTYISKHPGTNYYVDLAKLGDRILLVKASGYVHSYEMSEYLEFMDDYISNYFDRENGIVYLDDYADIEGSDSAARKKYIDHYQTLRKNKVVIAAMLYNQPVLWRISYNIAKRLHLLDDVFDGKTYEQSVGRALEIISQYDDSPVSSQYQDPDFLNFLEKSSEKAKQFYRHLTEQMANFVAKPSLRVTRKVQQQYSDTLLRYVESIDWHREGIDAPQIPDSADKSVKKVFNAVNYIKSDIDNLLKERDAAEQEFRESEARYRQLVEHAKTGILEFDYQANRIVSVNDSLLDISGYTRNEVLSMNPMDLMAEESKKIYSRRFSQRLAGEIISPDSIYQFISKSGQKKWVQLNTNINYKDGQPYKADVVVTDISHLKAVESELVRYQSKLKQLSIELSKSEESQKRHLASRLHEGVGQELFVAQLKLNELEKALDDPEHQHQLDEIREQILRSIKEVKGVTYDLSPPVLYDLGLKEAVQSLAKSIESKYHLPVKVRFSGPLGSINDEIKIITYRVMKEIVQNTVKHARAGFVDIIINNDNNTLNVDVTDNGGGFDAEGMIVSQYTSDGFGLFDVREKINHLGGQLTIRSTPGSGTRISLNIPVSEPSPSAIKN